MVRNQKTPYAWLTKIMPKWALKKSSRRVLVVLLAITPIVIGLLTSSIAKPYNLVFLTLLGLLFLWFYLLIGATQALAEIRDEFLDEREIALRNAVYVRVFRVIVVLVGLIFLFAQLQPENPLNARFTTLLCFYTICLPTAILAWIQPDPIFKLE